eukprot:Rhum_TRINITY_DN15420_c1_g10::Rhum_TRINITY_DN15420_c1_g10_i1::g.155661::m.155661
MVAVDSQPHPSTPKYAKCFVCQEAAAFHCEKCFDEENGRLYLCGKEECFDATHSAHTSGTHRKSLLPWDAATKWTEKRCKAQEHKNSVLALWCETCSALLCPLDHWCGDEHKKHKVSLIAKVWRVQQRDAEGMIQQLDDEVMACSGRLEQLVEEQDALASGRGAVGAARRALDQVEALVAAKVSKLRRTVDMAAENWAAEAAAEHKELGRYAQSARSLADKMRATCAEDDADEAQRVVLTLAELRAQRVALGSAPPVSVRGLELWVDPLRSSVAKLDFDPLVSEQVF